MSEALHLEQNGGFIRFEPGDHHTEEDEYTATDHAVQSGNPDNHYWNAEIQERLSSYGPMFLTIDSQMSFINDRDPANVAWKQHTWKWLPGRPSALNGNDHIYVLAADNLYANTHYDDLNRHLADGALFGATIAVGAAAGALGDQAVYMVRRERAAYDNKEVHDNQTAANEISRRKFLMRLGMVAGALFAVSPGASSLIAGYSRWHVPTEAMMRYADVTEPYENLPRHLFGDDIFLDGRTALLIDKTADFFGTYGGDAPVFDEPHRCAVLMGATHIHQAHNMISDPEMRLSKILKLTGSMAQAAFDGVRFYSDESDQTTPEDRLRGIYARQENVSLIRVDEPDKARFKADPIAEIDRIVTLVGIYTSHRLHRAIETANPH